MAPNLTLELVNGQQLEASLIGSFRPDDGEIDLLLEKNGEKCKLPLSEICCFLFNDDFDQFAFSSNNYLLDNTESLEEVEIVSGKRFQTRLIVDQEFQTGFFARSIDDHVPHKLIFFVFDGIMLRSQHSRLCEILKKNGLIRSSDIQKTLAKQQSLKSRRVGEIISEQNKISINNVEAALQRSRKNDTIPPNTRVGDILIAAGLVTRQQVDEALASQQSGRKKKIGQLLIECGLVSEDQVLSALSTKFRMRFVSLEDITPHPKALNALPGDLIRKLHIFPIEYTDDRLVVATSNPTDSSIPNIIRFSTHQKLELVVATSNDIAAAANRYIPEQEDIVKLITRGSEENVVFTEEEEPEDPVLTESDSQIVRLCNQILIDAYEKNASDIHFEPGTRDGLLIIRYRTEGFCKVVHRIPTMYKKPLISRLKIISGLDITEHRKPQSGKILLAVKNTKVEYRVEITPTVGGNEDAVLRVLSGSKTYPLGDMGFSPENLENLKKILAKPFGILLCVGPTGSGKTTTLHSALDFINSPIRKIWTVEDPVEITQPGLRQVQVNPKAGYTFQKALRSFLRADPDVIMIGEMRDSETAQIAIQASLTGHFVLSTLHTNSAPETIVRLTEMGIDPLNFSDALLGILSQRLTLKLCDHCKKPYHPSYEEYTELVEAYDANWFKAHKMENYTNDFTLMKKIGCERCDSSGYKGRIALHELLMGTEQAKTAIKKQYSATEIKNQSLSENMKSMKMDGISKVFQGITVLSQVLKVCG
jgi:type II secretory ATPase GspE/PulE/Tfp pilus assembly ATPase PilB-like protein